jgi:hypothetical protein
MADKEGNWFKRHKILTVILVIVALGVIGSALGGGSDTTSTSTSPKSSESSENEQSATAKIGEPARDGKFEFTVSKVKCGEKSVGDQFLKEKAQGQFCRLSLSIKNIGNEAQSLFSSEQKLFDDKGSEYVADDTATIYASSDSSGSTWFDEINPGNSVKGDILFDVPAGTKIVSAELHDSAFSGGVKVDLK